MPKRRKAEPNDGPAPKKSKTSRTGKKDKQPVKKSTKSAQFYQSGTSANVISPIQQNLSKLFDSYRDDPKDYPDKINIDGAQKYLSDIDVGLDEVAFLAVSDLLQCPSVGEFDREAFITGWRNASIADKPLDTVARQSQHIDSLRKKLATDQTYLKQVYRNAFKLSRPEGQRSVPVDTAVDMWNLFFRKAKGGIEWNTAGTKWLDMWCEFYETRSKRPVNKDLWNMVGELVMKTQEPDGETLNWWTEDGAWPMAIDEFVTYVKDKRKSGGEPMDTT